MNAMGAVIVGGGVFWAYKNGHLDELLARLLPKGQGVTISPVSSPVSPSGKPSGNLTKEEQILLRNWADVQPWARKNAAWVAAMMYQESGGKNNAVSHKGARGVLQVMPGTQGDIYKWGWRKYPADPNMLHIENIGVYYGTAYLQILSKTSSDKEWITRAYNAGPGGKLTSGKWPRETIDYLAKIKIRYREILANKEVA